MDQRAKEGGGCRRVAAREAHREVLRTAATAFFGALIHLAQGLPRPARRLVSVVAVVVIVLVAVARVTLRAHWPTDAAGGIALGAALASAAALIDRRRAS